MAGREMLNESTPAGKAAGMVVNPLSIPRRMEEGAREALRNLNVQKITDLLTNKGSVDELIKISVGQGGKLNPRNAILVMKALNVAGHAGVGVARDPDTVPETKSPGEFNPLRN
jgi:hypothetical protein